LTPCPVSVNPLGLQIQLANKQAARTWHGQAERPYVVLHKANVDRITLYRRREIVF
jgi:hypothetical protein